MWALLKPEEFFPNLSWAPEVDNLLDTDFYKLSMLDFILAHPEYAWVNVRWSMKIRNPEIRTKEVIPREVLEEQLEMTKNSITWLSESEISYLRWMERWDWIRMFREETLNFLKDFSLPDFVIWEDGDNYTLDFTWPWESSMMWEIIALKIINALYISRYIKKSWLKDTWFTEMMNEVSSRLFRDIKTLKESPQATFSEFGTRRSMSSVWQRDVNKILADMLPEQYAGTSNVLIAKEMGWANPRGTNAHELRMIPTALVDSPEDIISETYEVDKKWQAHYPELALLLPDAYGTSFYLQNAPEEIIKKHTGMRFDSKDPMVAIPEYIGWLIQNGQNPLEKIWIPSDGLDAKKVVEISNAFHDKLWKLSFWIWTNLTNNSKWSFPTQEKYGPFGSFSVVIKPRAVERKNWEWVSTVKLSDNPNKAMWDRARIEHFKRTFGTQGMQVFDVQV